jgi:hypothetical protein
MYSVADPINNVILGAMQDNGAASSSSLGGTHTEGWRGRQTDQISIPGSSIHYFGADYGASSQGRHSVAPTSLPIRTSGPDHQ